MRARYKCSNQPFCDPGTTELKDSGGRSPASVRSGILVRSAFWKGMFKLATSYIIIPKLYMSADMEKGTKSSNRVLITSGAMNPGVPRLDRP